MTLPLRLITDSKRDFFNLADLYHFYFAASRHALKLAMMRSMCFVRCGPSPPGAYGSNPAVLPSIFDADSNAHTNDARRRFQHDETDVFQTEELNL
jgi:hypothetical protein